MLVSFASSTVKPRRSEFTCSTAILISDVIIWILPVQTSVSEVDWVSGVNQFMLTHFNIDSFLPVSSWLTDFLLIVQCYCHGYIQALNPHLFLPVQNTNAKQNTTILSILLFAGNPTIWSSGPYSRMPELQIGDKDAPDNAYNI